MFLPKTLDCIFIPQPHRYVFQTISGIHYYTIESWWLLSGEELRKKVCDNFKYVIYAIIKFPSNTNRQKVPFGTYNIIVNNMLDYHIIGRN